MGCVFVTLLILTVVFYSAAVLALFGGAFLWALGALSHEPAAAFAPAQCRVAALKTIVASRPARAATLYMAVAGVELLGRDGRYAAWPQTGQVRAFACGFVVWPHQANVCSFWSRTSRCC